MLKWTVPRRAEPADELSSILPADPTPRRYTARQSYGGPSQRPRDQRRRSLVASAFTNKENDLLASQQSIISIRNPVATSTPFASHQQKALRDVGNTTPTTTASPNTLAATRKRHLPLSPTLPIKPTSHKPYASTIPTFGVEYSPMNATRSGPAIALRGLTVPDSFFGNARYFQDGEMPAKRQKTSAEPPRSGLHSLLQRTEIFNNNEEEEDALNMSSKALNDDDLNQMIDDILKSKRKPAPTDSTRRSLLKPPATQRKLHQEMTTSTEISDKLKQFMDSHRAAPMSPSPPAEPTNPLHDLIHDHPFLKQSIDILASLNTPPKDNRTVSAASDSGCNLKQRGSPIACNDISPSLESNVCSNQAATTPTNESQQTIRRCLHFSESPESLDDWLEKRKSVASTVSTTSSRCSMRSSGSTASGLLDVVIAGIDDRVHVHVIRCKNLYRMNGGPINAYVKLAVLSATPTGATSNGYQRTSVHRNSTRPLFDHRFVFEGVRPDPPADEAQRVQLTVWHRDRELKRSEFLGCLSFPVEHILSTAAPITGTFRLQPQSCLTNPYQAIPESNPSADNTTRLTEETLRHPNDIDAQLPQEYPDTHKPKSHAKLVVSATEMKANVCHTKGENERKAGTDMFTCLDRRKSEKRKTIDPAFKNSLCAH